ncbi:MAG: flagellar biosynthesis anti-sigma factor FlgM [Lachnospiraceae bacterium]|nr:flagellar biosynthesis anti-sigma factor FlgM [Lachnospiraceae bacterium]
MKISIGTILNNHTDLRSVSRSASGNSITPDNDHSFDAVIIKSNPRQIEEHTFAKAVSKELSTEVRETASQEKIQDLRQQVTDGRYSIDAYAVAARILLS